MRRRARAIRARRPVFLGCEGESEQACGALLGRWQSDANVPVHLEVVNLNPGAGDPIARLRRACQEINRRERRRADFWHKAVLMDTDQIAGDQQRRRQAENFAVELGMRIIWQEPCHEALLLRHLPGCSLSRPPDGRASEKALMREWPEYAKPMTRIALGRRLGVDAVRQVSTVEPALTAFLLDIGLLKEP